MGEKWPDIIGWFVTMKCWIILVYSNAWVSWNCSLEEEEIMTIIGPFLDGISWRNCREIISLRIRCGCCYFDLEYELCCSSKVSRRKRRNEIHWKKKWSVDFSWIRRKGNCSIMRWTSVPIRERFYKPLQTFLNECWEKKILLNNFVWKYFATEMNYFKRTIWRSKIFRNSF
jgi:hypothetical protein